MCAVLERALVSRERGPSQTFGEVKRYLPPKKKEKKKESQVCLSVEATDGGLFDPASVSASRAHS